MQPAVAQLLPDLTAVCLCVAAAHTDLRTYRIPNYLTGAGFVIGFVEHSLLALDGGRNALDAAASAGAGALLCLAVFGALAVIGSMGLGDVKLMTALGALFSMPIALSLVVYVLIAGGVVAVGFALGRGRLLESLRNIARGRVSLGDRNATSAAARLDGAA